MSDKIENEVEVIWMVGGEFVCAERGRGQTTVVFAIIGYHEHHLPFEDVVVHQATRYPGEVFGGLHVFELTGEEPSCACYGACHAGGCV